MQDLISQIRALRQKDGDPLPSVRRLAAHVGRAPLTVHRALCALRDEGVVHALDRKGFFWGERSSRSDLPAPRVDRGLPVRERLVADLRAGVYHPHRELPSRGAMAPLYGVGPGKMGEILAGLAEEGILSRRGRGYALPPPPHRVEQGNVLLVTRCGRDGALLLDTERQTDFVKSVQREGRERGLRIVVVGWNDDEGEGVFLDQDGRPAEPARFPGLLLGALVSTWLVREPGRLVARLRRLRVPVSAWWEHSPEDFPRVSAGAGLVGFDISFGPSSGIAVGRHLRTLGEGPVAFVSPFHGSCWSKARLEGLRTGLRGSALSVETFVDERAGSAHDLHLREGGVPQGEEALRALLGGFLDQLLPLRHPVWVVVNDHAALELISLLRARGIPRPRIVSFDNSSGSDAFQFDSFEFHTDGMVRQMLYHVLHPKARLFRAGGLHEMVGRLVLRR